MSKITTGVGLCALALSIVAFPIIDRALPRAEATVPTAAVQAIASAAHAQAGGGAPTVVWYQAERVYEYNAHSRTLLFRAWSDGTIEARIVEHSPNGPCEGDIFSQCPDWTVVSSPTQGFKAAADINADEKVDGEDLATILASWGDAPRVPFPPSDCPLNLVNP